MRYTARMVLGTLLACGGGSDAEFILACAAGTPFDETVCGCLAAKLDSELSSESQALLIATLQGDPQRILETREGLSGEEISAVGTFMVNRPADCMTP